MAFPTPDNDLPMKDVRAVPRTEADRVNDVAYRQSVGRRLVAARKALGQERREWITRYQIVPSKLSQWETGKCLPDMQILSRICLENDLSLDYVLAGISRAATRPRVRVKALSRVVPD